jgi:hypothetical protein
MNPLPIPKPFQVALSLSTWFVMFVGLIVIRMETHPWVNTVLLTIVFPVFIWYMSKSSILGSVSRGGIMTAVIGSGLFMTLLLEAFKKTAFSIRLKKNLKEFGRKPTETSETSFFIVLSMMVGLGVSYAIHGNNFISL